MSSLSMVKYPFRNSKSDKTDDDKNLFKYSVYMQSRDSKWLNRNIQNNRRNIDSEPIEEDIRD